MNQCAPLEHVGVGEPDTGRDVDLHDDIPGDGIVDDDVAAGTIDHAIQANRDVHDEDDLEDDGETDPRPASLESIFEEIHERCLAAMNSWPIAAIGRRPADWLAHDLLLHNLLRDARIKSFQVLLKNPPGWMVKRVGHLPSGQQRRGLQLAALHYQHLRQLASVRDHACSKAKIDNGAEFRRWQRLWNCRPFGADYEGRQERRKDHPCGMTLLCPWCWARAGVRIWKLLDAQLGNPTLMLLRWSLTSDDLDSPRGRMVVRMNSIGATEMSTANDGLWWLPPGMWSCVEPKEVQVPSRKYKYAQSHFIDDAVGFGEKIEDPYTILTAKQVRAARAEIRQHLDFWADKLGIASGMTAFRVEPTTWCHPRANTLHPQYRFVGHLLGQGPAGPWPDMLLKKFLLTYGDPSHECDVDSYLHVGKLRGRANLLIRALAWPSITLFTPLQWQTYAKNTKGWPLYRTFGSWRQVLATPPKPDRPSRLKVQQPRRPRPGTGHREPISACPAD
jgi:hypothetical protein